MELDQRRRILLLAVGDMDQVIEAAQAIQREEEREMTGDEPNMELVRALETAVAVCYWRPFTNSSVGRLDPENDAPEDDDLRDLHWELKTLRDKVYAHTDEEAGREVSFCEMGGGGDSHVITEGWDPLPSEWLPDVIALAEQATRPFLVGGAGLLRAAVHVEAQRHDPARQRPNAPSRRDPTRPEARWGCRARGRGRLADR